MLAFLATFLVLKPFAHWLSLCFGRQTWTTGLVTAIIDLETNVQEVLG